MKLPDEIKKLATSVVAQLKAQSALLELPLVQKGSRLSVMPVTPEQWAVIVALR